MFRNRYKIVIVKEMKTTFRKSRQTGEKRLKWILKNRV
jgi:hypothetical protein